MLNWLIFLIKTTNNFLIESRFIENIKEKDFKMNKEKKWKKQIIIEKENKSKCHPLFIFVTHLRDKFLTILPSKIPDFIKFPILYQKFHKCIGYLIGFT